MKEILAFRRVNCSKLAKQLGCSRQLVSHWRRGRQKIPAERAKAIEEKTGGVILRHELRPDLWDAPRAYSEQPKAREAA